MTAANVLRIAIVAVLKRSRGKFGRFHTVAKLSISGANVHDCVSVRQRPCQTIDVADESLGSTNVLDSRPGSTSISDRVVPLIGTS